MGQSVDHWYQGGARLSDVTLVFSDIKRCQLRDCGCLTSPRGPRCLPRQGLRECKSSHRRLGYCGDSEGPSFWRPGSSYPTGTCSTRHQPASPLIPYHLWTEWGYKRADGGAEEGLEDRLLCSRDRIRRLHLLARQPSGALTFLSPVCRRQRSLGKTHPTSHPALGSLT